jgi:hypothetical protein
LHLLCCGCDAKDSWLYFIHGANIPLHHPWSREAFSISIEFLSGVFVDVHAACVVVILQKFVQQGTPLPFSHLVGLCNKQAKAIKAPFAWADIFWSLLPQYHVRQCWFLLRPIEHQPLIAIWSWLEGAGFYSIP